jgi:hypothetical protein
MTRSMMATTAAVLLGCGSAFAQVGGISILPGASPLGMTSPLGVGQDRWREGLRSCLRVDGSACDRHPSLDPAARL